MYTISPVAVVLKRSLYDLQHVVPWSSVLVYRTRLSELMLQHRATYDIVMLQGARAHVYGLSLPPANVGVIFDMCLDCRTCIATLCICHVGHADSAVLLSVQSGTCAANPHGLLTASGFVLLVKLLTQFVSGGMLERVSSARPCAVCCTVSKHRPVPRLIGLLHAFVQRRISLCIAAVYQ